MAIMKYNNDAWEEPSDILTYDSAGGGGLPQKLYMSRRMVHG